MTGLWWKRSWPCRNLKLKTLLIIISLLGSNLQNDFRFSGAVEARGDIFRSDPFGNIHVVSGSNITRYNAGMKSVGDYNNPHLGEINSVDVSDPLRVLLYYKDHNQVIWLDNYLKQIRSPVFLDELGIDQAELVCTSSQGGFWVLDGLTSQIIYYDTQLQPVHRSMSLGVLWEQDVIPVFMIEKNRQLFLNVPGTGILVFDRFGNYSKTLTIEVPLSFQVTDDKLYYFSTGALHSYDLLYGELTPIALRSGDRPEYAEVQPETLFIYTESGFRVYKTDP